MNAQLSTAVEPIKWGEMHCHNCCYQTEVHETRPMASFASWVMIPEAVYAIQRIWADSWSAGMKHRHHGFRAFSGQHYKTADEARAVCHRHKFETIVEEIAAML
jgi:hypothetical protein